MFGFWLQIALALGLFLFASACALYEGSAIVNNPWEWKYSTPFSEWLYGSVSSSHDHISQLDYFIYAFKFQPTYPILMVLSGLYAVLLIGYRLSKRRTKWFSYYLLLLSAGLLGCSLLISGSPTFGGHVFFFIWTVSGLLCMSAAFLLQSSVFSRFKGKIIK
ncbi:YjdJ family protein [Bacillus massiliglaciei]|uniref:YjdJ family protein n=1 Tax=Bacillus massiliglaciei TaxID=1816693 RepID=UPI000A439A56|nr:YjdJ family protein [Bacillus massiliglaciei]